MNTIFKSIIYGTSLLSAVCLFTACDNVPEDERRIPIERPEIASRVLIQEFTGQWCTNCPDGAAAVHDLIEAFPDAVVAVCLHPEGTAYTRPLGDFVLTSSVATAYYDYYRPDAFPAAIINGASPETNYMVWGSLAMNCIEEPAPMDVNCTSAFDESTRKLTIDYDVIFNQVYDGELVINVWLTEDNIVGAQIVGARPQWDYVHNHVLRTSATGDWGLSIGNKFVPDEHYTGTVSLDIAPEWNADNCNVVAFIQTPGSRIVHQAFQTKAISED